MGKSSAQIEREIAEHREYLTRRIDELESRVRRDVRVAKAEAQGRASELLGDDKGLNAEQTVRDHPLPAVTGALGLGVLLGIASDSFGSGGEGRSGGQERYYGQRDGGNGGGGLNLGGFASPVLEEVQAALQDELRHLVRDGMEALRDKGSGERSRDGGETGSNREQRAASHESDPPPHSGA